MNKHTAASYGEWGERWCSRVKTSAISLAHHVGQRHGVRDGAARGAVLLALLHPVAGRLARVLARERQLLRGGWWEVTRWGCSVEEGKKEVGKEGRGSGG